MMPAAECDDFDGMTLDALTVALGKPPSAVKAFLYHRGYRYTGRYFRRIESALEVEQAVHDRIAAMPPTAPCWRCGARQGCDHRSAVAA